MSMAFHLIIACSGACTADPRSSDSALMGFTHAPAHLLFAPRGWTSVLSRLGVSPMGFAYAPTHCPQKFGFHPQKFHFCAFVVCRKSLDGCPQQVGFCPHGFHVCPYTFGLSPQELDWCPQKSALSPTPTPMSKHLRHTARMGGDYRCLPMSYTYALAQSCGLSQQRGAETKQRAAAEQSQNK